MKLVEFTHRIILYITTLKDKQPKNWLIIQKINPIIIVFLLPSGSAILEIKREAIKNPKYSIVPIIDFSALDKLNSFVNAERDKPKI